LQQGVVKIFGCAGFWKGRGVRGEEKVRKGIGKKEGVRGRKKGRGREVFSPASGLGRN